MDPFDKIFDGQVDPSTLEGSNSTFDLKVLFLVHYSLAHAQVALSKFGIHSVRHDADSITVKGFLWEDKKSHHTQLRFDKQSNTINRFFTNELAAKRFLTFARLHGYAVKEDIIKPVRKPLRRISIKPKDTL